MLSDVYVLAERSEHVLAEFRRKHLSGFREAAEEYEFPQYAAEPDFVTEDLRRVIDVLLQHSDEHYAIYWNNSVDGDVRSAMVFFTNDGRLIFGLSVLAPAAQRTLAELLAEAGSQVGGVLFETPPPASAEEFIAACRTTEGGSL
ncbi:MAG: hypothetical protein QGH94_02900 [Phycisphaerae bacterium]|jgi:hypothetical protein|nr:hypothetical protein [Phycisphaerae bacterium]MDP7286923.1 hypothetical protein [Phycisphaerae bacterium]